ncbi:ventral homeobox [Genypterus blacodes]|uniref:ventral homeobox n=1 Tax=Genypterus blacodes TaxID=154954 RepID=UPI003F77380A
MVKYFSADWLAQSHNSSAQTERDSGVDSAQSHRPHIPCMVQPRPPTFGERYLQRKPKPSRCSQHVDPAELNNSRQEPDPSSPLRPTNCTTPNSEISEYSSGYESEAASSECLSVDEGTEGDRDVSQRRVRTKFTPEQIEKLEKIFTKHKYLDAGERVKTAEKLNLSETQVRTWFQNRRMKLKREVQDYLAPRVPPLMYQPMHPVQYHSMGGQRLTYSPVGQAFYPASVPHLPADPRMMLNPHFY